MNYMRRNLIKCILGCLLLSTPAVDGGSIIYEQVGDAVSIGFKINI